MAMNGGAVPGDVSLGSAPVSAHALPPSADAFSVFGGGRKPSLKLPTIDLTKGPRVGRDPEAGPWIPAPDPGGSSGPLDPAKAALVAAESRIKHRLQLSKQQPEPPVNAQYPPNAAATAQLPSLQEALAATPSAAEPKLSKPRYFLVRNSLQSDSQGSLRDERLYASDGGKRRRKSRRDDGYDSAHGRDWKAREWSQDSSLQPHVRLDVISEKKASLGPPVFKSKGSKASRSMDNVNPRIMDKPVSFYHLEEEVPVETVAQEYPGSQFYNPQIRFETDYDYDADNLSTSLTLPRIEAVLRAEGIKPQSISQQIDKIKERCKRQHDYQPPPPTRPKGRRKHFHRGHNLNKNPSDPAAKIPFSRQCTVTSQANAPANQNTPRPAAPNQPTPRQQLTRQPSLAHVTPREVRDSVLAKADQDLNAFIGVIEHTRWLSNQQLEKGTVPVNFAQPRIILVSSNIPRSGALVDHVVKKDPTLLTLHYDFEQSTYESLLEEMKSKLNSYQEGCRAKSILLFCQGGPGYYYMLKRKVVTPQKLQKKDQTDLIEYWRGVGDLMSKLSPTDTFVHFMGSDIGSKKQGALLFKELKKLMHPNLVHFYSPEDETEQGRETISLYMDYHAYRAWRDQPREEDVPQDTELDAIQTVQRHNLPGVPNNGTTPATGANMAATASNMATTDASNMAAGASNMAASASNMATSASSMAASTSNMTMSVSSRAASSSMATGGKMATTTTNSVAKPTTLTPIDSG